MAKAKVPAKKAAQAKVAVPTKVLKNSPYSFQNVVGFVNDNFGILFIALLMFFAGFFIGSLWTENQLRKSGGLGSGSANAGTGTQQVGNTGPVRTELTRDNFIKLSGDLGINKDDFIKCFDSNKYETAINQSETEGQAVGINGTPGTVVVVNGVPKELISGAQPYAQLKATIDKYLKDPNTKPTATNGLVVSGYVPVTAKDHLRGNKNASVILVEYSDYECPFCYQFHPTITQALNEYKDKIALVYRHYPLTNIHPSAMPSALAAECVAELKGEDAFWKFSDKLFE